MIIETRLPKLPPPVGNRAATRPAGEVTQGGSPAPAPAVSVETLGTLKALQVPEMTASAIARMLSKPESALASLGMLDPNRAARLLAV
jgi:hypothetical protein